MLSVVYDICPLADQESFATFDKTHVLTFWNINSNTEFESVKLQPLGVSAI